MCDILSYQAVSFLKLSKYIKSFYTSFNNELKQTHFIIKCEDVV